MVDAERPVVALPRQGEVFLDQRGGDRALRVSWHPEDGLVVLSLWHGARCTATFRMPLDDVPALIQVLVAGLPVAAATRELPEPRAAGDAG